MCDMLNGSSVLQLFTQNKDKLRQTHITRQMCKNIGTRQ